MERTLRQQSAMAYPYSARETIADAVVHVAGLAFAIPASVMLLENATAATKIPTAVYIATLIFSLAASAIYHLSPHVRSRNLLGRVDHAAIYFKIAGTYTPLVAAIGTSFAYVVAGLVWLLAIVGALAKLGGWGLQARGSLALYLGMGWLSVLLIVPMWQHLPMPALGLVAIGGITYSLGTIIYARDAMPYQNAVWHAIVLLASVCFFAAIWQSI